MPGEVKEVVAFVAFLVPVVSLFVSIFTFTQASKQRNQKSAAEQAEIAEKLDTQIGKLEKMDGKLDELSKGYHENHENISRLETKVEDIEKDLSNIQSEMTTFRTDIQNFETDLYRMGIRPDRRKNQ